MMKNAAREKMFNVAEAMLNLRLSRNSMLVGISGRYEFKNKGIDVFIDSLGILNKRNDIVDVIL